MKFNKSHFEDYLSERLPETEKNNFEDSLRDDADLKHSFNFYKKNRPSPASGEHLNENVVTSAEPADAPPQFTMLSFIYSISLLGAIGFLSFSAIYWHAVYNYTNDALQKEFLFEEYDITMLEENISETKGSQIHLQEVVLAQQYFRSRSFEESVEIFDKIIANNTSQPDIFGESNSLDLLERTEWNRIIALLLLEHYDEQVSDSLNDIIVNEDHSYHQEALALDAKMKSFMRGWVASI